MLFRSGNKDATGIGLFITKYQVDSMGGHIALMYAGLRPERVARVMSLDGMGLRRTVPEDAIGRYREWLDALREPPEPLRDYDSIEVFTRVLRTRHPQDAARFAEKAWVQLQQLDGCLHLAIYDDGKVSVQPSKEGFGLIGIRERARLLHQRHHVGQVQAEDLGAVADRVHMRGRGREQPVGGDAGHRRHEAAERSVRASPGRRRAGRRGR